MIQVNDIRLILSDLPIYKLKENSDKAKLEQSLLHVCKNKLVFEQGQQLQLNADPISNVFVITKKEKTLDFNFYRKRPARSQFLEFHLSAQCTI